MTDFKTFRDGKFRSKITFRIVDITMKAIRMHTTTKFLGIRSGPRADGCPGFYFSSSTYMLWMTLYGVEMMAIKF